MSEKFDTIVVPARPENYKKIFKDKNCWHGVRIAEWRKEKIMHLAIYQTAPVSKVTHYIHINTIRPWKKDKKKCELIFKGDCHTLKSGIALTSKNKKVMIRSSRYTTIEKINKATCLEEVFD